LRIGAAVEPLRRALIPVCHALAVTGVMLPAAPATALPTPFHICPVILTVDIPVNIGIAVDVDVDIPAVPVAAAPGIAPGSAGGDAQAE
jgi:hypothetical protein